jgi:hypothetical protein
MDKRVLVGAVVGGLMVAVVLLVFLLAVPVTAGRGATPTAWGVVQFATVDSQATQRAQETKDRQRKREQEQKCATYKERRATVGVSGGWQATPGGCN